MLKYLYSQVYVKEVPDEISLGLSILGCPIHCLECHSPHTWNINCGDDGIDLTLNKLKQLIIEQKYITNVLFFGGEWEPIYLEYLLSNIKDDYKCSLYTGHNLDYMQEYDALLNSLTYLKVGSYNPILGSIDYPSTNQRLYKLKNGKIEKDITYKFWKTPNIN